MRITLLSVLALVSTVLAGCSDDPPAGELAGTSATVPAEGTLNVETQEFQAGAPDPSGGANPAYDPCPFEQVPSDPQDPVAAQRCTFPYTRISIHMMALPDPQAASYKAFLVDAEDVTPAMDLGTLSQNGTAPNLMYELTWSNEDDCDGSETNEGCVLTEVYDAVEIRLDSGVPVATGALSGSSFAPHPSLQGTSFTLVYEGKSGTLELTGTNATLSYQAVFYVLDEAGVAQPQETHPVTEGTNEIETESNLSTFDEVHIHVANTKVNVARAAVA